MTLRKIENLYIRNPNNNKVLLGFISVLCLIFLLDTLPNLNELRDEYILKAIFSPFQGIGMRYLIYLFMGGSLWFAGIFIKQNTPLFKDHFNILINFIAIVILSVELTNLLVLKYSDISSLNSIKEDSFRLGYSVLWGIYSFGMVVYGFWKKRRIFRLMGILFFAVTLVKVFVFDIQYVTTISKIITFIGLGVLLLIVSFLYQKYKAYILSEDEG